MIRYLRYILFIGLLFPSFCLAESYIIKLASYQDKSNLLIKVAQLESPLQNNIVMHHEDNLYKLFTKTPHDKNTTLAQLPRYQKIFPDAFLKQIITTHIQEEPIHLPHTMVKEANMSTLETNTSTSIPLSTSIMHPQPTTQTPHTFRQLLENKTYYLCPDSIHTPSEKLLIQADFTVNDVNFTTLRGKVPPLSMQYMIQKNRLYLINNGHLSPSQYNTVDKIFFEYMVLSRWMKGKKIFQMRYYKKEEDAKSYLDSIF